MASNDLMMRIQLLVDSGRASQELKRLESALKSLRDQVSKIETTRLAPLSKQIDDLRQSSAQLKTVNLGNFASEIARLKTAMGGLGVNIRPLDDLRKAFADLQSFKAADQVNKLKTQLQGVNKELQRAQRLNLTGPSQGANASLALLNQSMGRYDSAIRTSTTSLIDQRKEILRLKNELSALPKVKFDSGLRVALKNLSPGGVITPTFDASSIEKYNKLLAQQGESYRKAQESSRSYQDQLGKLRLEIQRAAVPELKPGGRDLLGNLAKQKADLQTLRTQQIVPLQNQIRKLSAEKGLEQALKLDPLNAKLKVARAQLQFMGSELNALRSKQSSGGALIQKELDNLAKYEREIPRLQRGIAGLNLNVAQTNQKLVQSYNERIAAEKKSLAGQKSKEALTANEIRGINQLIAAQKQLAQQNAQSVKTRQGTGLFDTQAAKLESQKLSELYKGNIKSLKDFYQQRQQAAKDDENLVRQRLQNAQQQLAAGQLTQAQWRAERASIQAAITAEKQRSRLYQQNLKDQRQGLQESLRAEQAKEVSLNRQISALRQQAGAQAQLRSAQLRGELGTAKGAQRDLQEQIRLNEAAARSELTRIRALDQGTTALGRQGQQLTTLGRLFKGSTGIVNEFSAALRFALGPQMAGFAAAGSIIQLVSGFVVANKEIENLNRGLNAITGAGTLYFEELRRIANATGQSMTAVTDSFLQLVSASKGTRLEGEATRLVFENVSRALVITGADAVRSRRAFLALAQMMSKGQVYAEELRQQLSEALPGSVQIFARALEITPQKMMELMKQGRISADALILFGEQLGKEFAEVGEEMFTFSQKAAVLQNELQRLFVEVGKTGIWNALGDALLKARDFVRGLADGVGAFGDTAKREIGAVAAAFRTLSFSPGDLFSGVVGLAQQFGRELVSGVLEALRQIPQLINELGFAGQLIDIRIGKIDVEPSSLDSLRKFINDNLLVGPDQMLGTTFEDLNRYWREFTDQISEPLPTPNFDQWAASFDNRAIRGNIERLRKELEKFSAAQARASKDGSAPDDERYARFSQRIAEIRVELGRLEEAQQRAFQDSVSGIEAQNEALKETNKALREARVAAQEIDANKEFIAGFDPKARSAITEAYRSLQDYQRASETVLRLEKESEQAIINRVTAAKKVLDIQNDIVDANRRAVQAQRSFDQSRARDARELLQLNLSQADALREAERNAKSLREGRVKAGVYFTPEQRKASEDELQAFKLRKQAAEQLQRAAAEGNQELKEGNLENAKLLLEQANSLLVSAGNTYLVKKNNEELLKIQKQLSGEVKDQRKQEEERLRGAELLAQARALLLKSEEAELPASVRDVYLEQVEDLAKKAQGVFAEIGLFDELKETAALRGGVADVLKGSANELEERIGAAITKFNEQTKRDASTAIAGLSEAARGLLALQRELEQQITETTTDAAREQLQSRLEGVQRELKVLEREYLQTFKRLQDAGKAPTEIEFISKGAPEVKEELEKPIEVPVNPVVDLSIIPDMQERLRNQAQFDIPIQPKIEESTGSVIISSLRSLINEAQESITFNPLVDGLKNAFSDSLKSAQELFKSRANQLELKLRLSAEGIEFLDRDKEIIPPVPVPGILDFSENVRDSALRLNQEWFNVLRSLPSESLSVPLDFDIPKEFEIPDLSLSSTGLDKSIAGLLKKQGRLGAIEFSKEFEDVLRVVLATFDVGLGDRLQIEGMEEAFRELLQGELLRDYGKVGVKVFADPQSMDDFISDFNELAQGVARFYFDKETLNEYESYVVEKLTDIRIIPVLDDKFLVLFSDKIDEMKALGREIDPFFGVENLQNLIDYYEVYRDLMDPNINPGGGLRTELFDQDALEATAQTVKGIVGDAESIAESIAGWQPPTDLRRLSVSTDAEQLLRETAALDALEERTITVPLKVEFKDDAKVKQLIKAFADLAKERAKVGSEPVDLDADFKVSVQASFVEGTAEKLAGEANGFDVTVPVTGAIVELKKEFDLSELKAIDLSDFIKTDQRIKLEVESDQSPFRKFSDQFDELIVRVKGGLSEFFSTAAVEPLPVEVRIDPVLAPDAQGRLQEQADFSIKPEWDASAVEEFLAASVESGLAWAATGDAATEAMRRQSAAALEHGQKLEELTSKSAVFLAAVKALNGEIAKPSVFQPQVSEPTGVAETYQAVARTIETAQQKAVEFLGTLQATAQPVVVPIQTEFQNEEKIRDLLAEVAALRAQGQQGIQVGVFVDTDEIKAKLAEIDRERAKPPLPVKLAPTVDPAAQQKAQQQVQALAQPVTVPVGIQFQNPETIARLKAELKALGGVNSVNLQTDAAKAKAEELRRELAKPIQPPLQPKADQASAQQAAQQVNQWVRETVTAIPIRAIVPPDTQERIRNGLKVPPLAVEITTEIRPEQIAEQSRQLKAGFAAQGIKIEVDTVVDRDEITGTEKDLQRLTAQDNRVEITPRTELLDAKLRDIDSQFQQLNRTAGFGITQGFEYSSVKVGQFANLVDQVNLKMRATQAIAGMTAEEIDKAYEQKQAIELQVKVNREKAKTEAEETTRRMQEWLKEPDPIRLKFLPENAVEAQRLIGEIQSDLQKLKDAGATNIVVTFDEKTGKLVVTADTSQADASVNEVIQKINASTAVLKVQVKYNDPGFTPRNTSVNVAKRRWGGPIPGYGGGDKVHAMLERGEFVLRKEAASAIGYQRLMEWNKKGRLPRTPRVRDSITVPHMATGGPVIGSPIVINLPGGNSVRGLSGSRDAAAQLAKLLTQTGRAL